MGNFASGPLISQPVNVPEVKKKKEIKPKEKIKLPNRKILLAIFILFFLGLGLVGLLLISINGGMKVSSVLGISTGSNSNTNSTIIDYIQSLLSPQQANSNNSNPNTSADQQLTLYTNKMLKYSIYLPFDWTTAKKVGGRLDDYSNNQFELIVSILEQTCTDPSVPTSNVISAAKVVKLASGQNVTFQESDDAKTGIVYCGVASITNSNKTLYIEYLKPEGSPDLNFEKTVLPIISRLSLN